jgi:hypothetical protein
MGTRGPNVLFKIVIRAFNYQIMQRAYSQLSLPLNESRQDLGGVAALTASLNWVDLSTSELTLARAAAVTTAGGTASLAASGTALLAGLHGINLAACEL